MRAIGLMSGTSLDGVDAALLHTDGNIVKAFGPALTVPYSPSFRHALRGVLGERGGAGRIAEVERKLTLYHAEAVKRLLRAAALGPEDIDVIGFHGQTIGHYPDQGRTRQIGDGGLLARETGIRVVYDFRSADMAAGGQGAPLVPVYHAALARDLEMPVAVVNLGGVANVTYIPAPGADLLAFDTGPGNALIDDLALRHTGEAIDTDGALAASGTVDDALLADMLRDPFFAQKPPKSLDRDAFAAFGERVAHLDPADGAATLTAFTAASVARARDWLPEAPRLWLVSGGGRRNPVLMRALSERLESAVAPVESVGWDGDALEAQAFAFLAVRTLRGLPLTFPGTTGVAAPQRGGRVATP